MTVLEVAEPVSPLVGPSSSLPTHRLRRAVRPFAGYLLVLPALGVLIVFYYVPALLLFVISFFHYHLGGAGSSFAGFDNFRVLFAQPLFWQSLAVTGYYVLVMVPATLVASLALAMLLRDGIRTSRRRRGGAAQALIFLPHVTPLVATSLVWVYIFDPQYGIANYVLRAFTSHPPNWLFSTHYSMPAIEIYSLWHSLGFYMVLFLAGLSTIPDRLVEAARVEGVRGFAAFRRVVFPLLTPTVYLVTVLATVNTMQAFSQIYTLSGGAHGHGGGPAYSTTTDALLIYQTAFTYNHFSLASAMSLILFAILLLLTLVQRWGFSKLVFYR